MLMLLLLLLLLQCFDLGEIKGCEAGIEMKR